MWVEYEYYIDTFLKLRDILIPYEEFAYYEQRAEFEIRRYIGADAAITDSLKLCCCEAAELFYRSERYNNTGVASESTGDLSISYESSDVRAASLSRNIRDCVYRYLADSGLLYRGI